MRPLPLIPATLAALCATALPTLAADPMNAEEFEAYVTGRTLTYSQYGTIFGIEEYLPNRKVRWQFTQDTCQYGSWFQKGEQICFVYEYDATEHCWTFWDEGGTLTALSANDLQGAELSELAQSDTGLACPGPDVGV